MLVSGVHGAPPYSIDTAVKRIAHMSASRPNWQSEVNSRHQKKVDPHRDPVFRSLIAFFLRLYTKW